jgi:hypothetical protein
MLDFSCFSVKNDINVVNFLTLFTKQCFKYITKTSGMNIIRINNQKHL